MNVLTRAISFNRRANTCLLVCMGAMSLVNSSAVLAQGTPAPTAPPATHAGTAGPSNPAASPKKVSAHADPRSIVSHTQTRTMTNEQRVALEKSGALKINGNVGTLHFAHINHGPKSPKHAQMVRELKARSGSGASGGQGSGQGPNLSYYGGPVLYFPIIIPVFWGFHAINGVPNPAQDPVGAVPVILSFLDDMANSAWLATLNQYYQGGNQFISSGSTIVTQPIFDDTTSPGASYGTGDVHNEVARLIQQGRATQNTMDIFVVVTPHGSINQDLVNGNDCAIHDSDQGVNFGFPSGITVSHNYAFASVPYLADPSWSCWTTGTGAITKAMGHEIAEAITDSYAGYVWNGVNYASWIVNPLQFSDPGWEIGDLCNGIVTQTSFYPGQAFTAQPLWSNQTQQCVAPDGLNLLYRNVSFQTSNGHFVTAANGGGLGEGGSSLQTDRTIPQSWETFLLLVDRSQNPPHVAFLAQSGNYVTANNGGGMGGPNTAASPMHTDATIVNVDEKYNIYSTSCASAPQVNALVQWVFGNPFSHSASCVVIQTANGDFLTAQYGGGQGGGPADPFRTNATTAQAWETFLMAPH
jgi:hypothetical protein